MIATDQGVVSASYFGKLADPKERWNADSLEAIIGTPWCPNPGSTDQEIHPSVRLPREDGPVPGPIDIPEEINPRRFRINRSLVKKLGLLITCAGCRAIRYHNPESVNHSEECRARIQKHLEDQGNDGKAKG